MNELHNFVLFLLAVFYVLCKTGLITIPLVAIGLRLLQWKLER